MLSCGTFSLCVLFFLAWFGFLFVLGSLWKYFNHKLSFVFRVKVPLRVISHSEDDPLFNNIQFCHQSRQNCFRWPSVRMWWMRVGSPRCRASSPKGMNHWQYLGLFTGLTSPLIWASWQLLLVTVGACWSSPALGTGIGGTIHARLRMKQLQCRKLLNWKLMVFGD